MRDFFYATATLVGTIVGVGVFGIPYVTAQAGFWVGQFFIVGVALVTLLVHLLYAEVVERTEGSHRLVGYAERYLGMGAKRIIGFAFFFSGYAALLIYIIVAGTFLEILSGGRLSSEWGSIIFWIFGSFAIWRGLRTVGWIELAMSALLVGTMGIIFVQGAPHIDIANFAGWSPAHIFLPYGVILFALSGATAIPEIRALLSRDGGRFGLAVAAGTLIPAVLYMIFAAVVVGVSGTETSREAIEGLLPFLGAQVVWIGALFGFLALATSFLVFGVNILNTIFYDYRVPYHASAALTVGIPGVLFFLGFRQFIEIMDITGAVLGAVIGVSILLMVIRARAVAGRTPVLSIAVPRAMIYGVAALLVLGGLIQVFYIISQHF